VSAPAGPDDADIRTGEYVQSLERGLSVLRAFNADRPAMTVADAAKATGLTRATARRILHTLQTLGYVCSDGKVFELTPLVLDLGHAYVSSLQLPDLAQPFMEGLSEQVHESVSAAVLDGEQVVYVARVPTQRIMAISLAIGSRLPAAWTSLGRVLLAGLDDPALDRFLAGVRFDLAPAEHSLRTVDDLRAEIHLVRRQGWALLDQELEQGVRSISAPLHDRRGRVVAALNVGTHAGRVSIDQLTSEILPHLLATARSIDAQLAKR
jgi:IclR family pca regulon transcriptional regulator